MRSTGPDRSSPLAILTNGLFTDLHAKTAHGITTIPPDVAAKVQAAIKDK